MVTDKIKVAVRVRPFSKRGKLNLLLLSNDTADLILIILFKEIDLDTPCVVKMENNQTFLQPPLAPDKDR